MRQQLIPTSGDLLHFVITRFNVPHADGDTEPCLNDEWLSGRFELFKQYCYPSIIAQTNQNFVWLVLFHSMTDSRWIACFRQIDTTARGQICYQPKGGNHAPQFMEEYISKNELKPKNILSTRFDSDDAISSQFVELLQNELKMELPNPVLLNFSKGMIWGNGLGYQVEQEYNPFISLLEPMNLPLKSVHALPHTQLKGFVPYHSIETHPAYVSNVHGGNILNTVRGKLIDPKSYKTYYQHLREVFPKSPTFLDQVSYFTPAAVKAIKYRLFKR